MPALRWLGLTILAALVVSIGALGYTLMVQMTDEGKARNAALEVEQAARAAIAGGSPQTVSISIPSNYVLRFVGNQITIDNWRIPSEGLALPFSDDAPELGAGDHRLTLTLEENFKIAVEKL